ncbi:MAG: hypothetical protein ACR2P7_03820 [bacterium]
MCATSASADEASPNDTAIATDKSVAAITTTPTDQTAEFDHSGGIRYQAQRVGNRLERITILRDNGLDETYRNTRDDTLWNAHENELGEVPIMRQWSIGIPNLRKWINTW